MTGALYIFPYLILTAMQEMETIKHLYKRIYAK